MTESESLKTNNRITDKHCKNFDPWEFCGQDGYCKRGLRDKRGCLNGCIVPKLYRKLAKIEDCEEKKE